MKPYDEMTDEELMQAPPPDMSAPETKSSETSEGEEILQGDDQPEGSTGETTSETEEGAGGAPSSEKPETEKKEDPEAAVAEESEGDGGGNAGAEAASEEEEQQEEPDYKSLYEKVMGTFRAGKKDFTPRSPEELIGLAQRGVDYTQKMQALAPRLRMMRMLENNELLNEDDIGFLIDLKRGDKGAIQKLLKDAQIDPIDMDTSEDPTYQPGNHKVSQEEMAIHSAIEDLRTTEEGNKTLSVIQNTWDQESKKALYGYPQGLQVINQQRINGQYDQISAEIERRKLVGQLSPNVPFIQAYNEIGQELYGSDRQAQSQGSTQSASKPPASGSVRQPAETRTVTRTKPMKDGGRARAAAASSTAATPKPEFDPLSMTDEQIMAMGRPPS